MPLTHFDELMEKAIAAGTEITTCGSVSDEKIHAAEGMLGVVFPPSYKEYLKKYGAIEIDNCSFAGLVPEDEAGSDGDVIAFTQYARENYGLPFQYIALDFEDGDAFLCIDTERKNMNGESPIVLVDPVNGKQMGSVVAASLPDYLVGYLTGYLSAP